MNNPSTGILCIIDAHVHIYSCFDLAALLESAYHNFDAEARRQSRGNYFTGILLLTETPKDNSFQQLCSRADKSEPLGDQYSSLWHFYHTDEDCSLLAENNHGHQLILIAGRQIITQEKLEVLALITRSRFPDGAPIRTLITAINERGAIPVLPWGVGKWLGKKTETC